MLIRCRNPSCEDYDSREWKRMSGTGDPGIVHVFSFCIKGGGF